MGIEYRISCPPDKLLHMEQFLMRIGGLPSVQFPEQIEFRYGLSGSDGMPDAFVVIQAAGIHFCDNCGDREALADLFRRIIDEALACTDSTDSITITGG